MPTGAGVLSLAGAVAFVGVFAGAPGVGAQGWGEPVVTKAYESAIVEPVARTAQFAAPRVLELPQATVSEQPWSPIITGAIGSAESAEGAPDPIAKSPPKKPAQPVAKADEVTRQKTAQRLAEAAVEQGRAPAATAEVAATAAIPVAPVKPLELLPPGASPVQQYCFNTTDAVADARVAWQAKKIADMEGELDKRVALLETKTEEFKTWLARRDEFSKKAQEKLVAFYTRMRPDAAALQLAAMDEETAAAVLTKIDAKAASAVMSEMEPARAAKLAGIISGAGGRFRARSPTSPRSRERCLPNLRPRVLRRHQPVLRLTAARRRKDGSHEAGRHFVADATGRRG